MTRRDEEELLNREIEGENSAEESAALGARLAHQIRKPARATQVSCTWPARWSE